MRLLRLLKNDLAKEIAEWTEDGLIHRDQAEAICSRYGMDYNGIQNRSFGYYVLIGLGYLFIGLSVITLIGANWEDIPRALRMSGLLVLTVGTQLLGMRSFYQGKWNSAISFMLLGNLFYGASIILIAQIYHLGEHMADGVFWWALGSLPFALLTRSPWLMLQSMLLAYIWFFMEVGDGFYPALFPLFIASAMWILWKGKSSILLLLFTAAAVCFWCEYSLAEWWRESFRYDIAPEHFAVTVALFIFSYALGQWMMTQASNRLRDYGLVLSLWGLRFGLIVMLVLTFREPWRELIRADWSFLYDMFFIVFVLIAASAYLAKLGGKLSRVVVFSAVFVVSLLSILFLEDASFSIYFQVLFNILLVVTGVLLIIRGVNESVSHYFFLGLVAILFTALVRYFDLVGDYIGGAILFMVFAAVMLGAAKYWRHAQTSLLAEEKGA